MDTKELIERLRNPFADPAATELCNEAADALEHLQAERDAYREVSIRENITGTKPSFSRKEAEWSVDLAVKILMEKGK